VPSPGAASKAAAAAAAADAEAAAHATLQLLLDHPQCDLETRDSHGRTPLMLAVTNSRRFCRRSHALTNTYVASLPLLSPFVI